MENKELFEGIASLLQLGSLQKPVYRVYGGYLHQMYCLETEKGKFALKLLNPLIMQRPTAMKNYQCAEALETKLEAARLPVVTALNFDGKKMQCFEGQYFYVFNWIEGSVMPSDQITVKHCQKIGRLLGEMHHLEYQLEAPHLLPVAIDWHQYVLKACEEDAEIAGLLAANEDLLYQLEQRGNEALTRLPAVSCICHGDMDVKNVLWQASEPYVIDLECLNIGSPYLEIFTLALSWSGYEQGNLDKQRLQAFIQAYQEVCDLSEVNWQVLYQSNMGQLEWLAYNIRRALKIESASEEERKLGIAQVYSTLEQIQYYACIGDELLEILNECTSLN